MHLNELLANGGVNSNLLAKSLQLLVGHDFDVESASGGSGKVTEMIVAKRRVLVVVVVRIHHNLCFAIEFLEIEREKRENESGGSQNTGRLTRK